jgi:hypothetical protein
MVRGVAKSTVETMVRRQRSRRLVVTLIFAVTLGSVLVWRVVVAWREIEQLDGGGDSRPTLVVSLSPGGDVDVGGAAVDADALTEMLNGVAARDRRTRIVIESDDPRSPGVARVVAAAARAGLYETAVIPPRPSH